jgi:hypothetical protein
MKIHFAEAGFHRVINCASMPYVKSKGLLRSSGLVQKGAPAGAVWVSSNGRAGSVAGLFCKRKRRGQGRVGGRPCSIFFGEKNCKTHQQPPDRFTSRSLNNYEATHRRSRLWKTAARVYERTPRRGLGGMHLSHPPAKLI